MKRLKKTLPAAQIRAALSESSVNEEARTVELVWTTGAKGLRSAWGELYYEELEVSERAVDLTRLREGAPLLAAHDSYSLDSVIGVVERAWIEGGLGKAIVRFASDENSDRVFQKVKERVLRNVSVGYSVQEYTEVDSEDEVPTYRATRWQPAEISIVPIGFDAGARTRNNENVNESEVEILGRSEEHSTQENDTMKLKPTIALDKAGDNEGGASALNAEEIRAQAAKAERQRVSEIRAAVRTAKLDEAFSDDLIERGVSADEARKVVLAKLAEASPAKEIQSTVRVEVTSDARDNTSKAIEGALLHRMAPKSFKPDDNARRYVGRTVLRMAEDLVGNTVGMSDAQIIQRAMTSSDLPLILANVAEKSAQAEYAIAPETFSPWTNRGDLRNYKEHSQVKLGDFSSLEEKLESGEYKYGSMGEKQEKAQLKDYGRMLKITKQMMINDDLSVLSQVVSRGGTAARRLESSLVYGTLLANPTMADGVALFHASHGNLGTASAINDAAMAAAFRAMREQKTVDGLDNLELAPRFLIVGPQKENEARKFLSSILANQTANVNIYAGSLQLVVENRIIGNQWFCAADPNVIDTITLFGLAGQQSPIIESRTRWEDSSMEFKVEHTATAAPMDFRGLYRNPGA